MRDTNPGAGRRRADGLCMRCGKVPPHYHGYPVCQPCWAEICRRKAQAPRSRPEHTENARTARLRGRKSESP